VIFTIGEVLSIIITYHFSHANNTTAGGLLHSVLISSQMKFVFRDRVALPTSNMLKRV